MLSIRPRRCRVRYHVRAQGSARLIASGFAAAMYNDVHCIDPQHEHAVNPDASPTRVPGASIRPC
jgi:hypothetical protein